MSEERDQRYADAREAAREAQRQLQERRAALEDTLASDGWQQVILPQLQLRLHELERRCMKATTLDAVRSYQGAWALIENMLTAPHAFFGVGDGEPEGKRDDDGPRRVQR